MPDATEPIETNEIGVTVCSLSHVHEFAPSLAQVEVEWGRTLVGGHKHKKKKVKSNKQLSRFQKLKYYPSPLPYE